MIIAKKAFLFAAGYGERLRPLTQTNPKPLLPIGDHLMIDYSLHYLKKFGIEEVVINLFHLGDKIEQHVKQGEKFGLKVFYSKETKLLGTGGGLKKAENQFKDEEIFITLNSDTLINCDLKAVQAFHQKQKAAATLVLAPWQEGYTRLEMANDSLQNIGSGNHLFTGLALFTPKIFSTLHLNPSNLIIDGVQPLMSKGEKIAAFVHDGFWRDIGTMENYQQAQEEWAVSHHKRI